MYAAASESKKRTTCATSCGVPKRPSGTLAIARARCVLAERRNQIRLDPTRHHGVDRDAVPADLAGERLGERVQAALCSGVVGLAGLAHLPRERAHVDDAARVRREAWTASSPW